MLQNIYNYNLYVTGNTNYENILPVLQDDHSLCDINATKYLEILTGNTLILIQFLYNYGMYELWFV